MKVYLVNAGYDYQGSRVDSVHATREAAQARAAKQELRTYYDWVDVEEFEVTEAL